MSKTALITGFTGQDGSYLAEHLLAKGYHVVGHLRRPNQLGPSTHLAKLVETTNFDTQSPKDWDEAMDSICPDEIYHLAGVSFVPDSWREPIETIAANLNVTVHVLESLRRRRPSCRLFYACSSEIFGTPSSDPQNELTPIKPRTPYGVTKAASYWMIESYRHKYGLFACSGILFNHESPRRPPSFVTRKITLAAAAISLGLQEKLILGNVDIARDWGFAGDYVDCMFRMLQEDQPSDFAIGTGRLCSLKQVAETAFNSVGLDWRDFVQCDTSFVREHDNKTVVADCRKASERLGWKATTSMESLIEMMVKSDLSSLRQTRFENRAA